MRLIVLGVLLLLLTGCAGFQLRTGDAIRVEFPIGTFCGGGCTHSHSGTWTAGDTTK